MASSSVPHLVPPPEPTPLLHPPMLPDRPPIAALFLIEFDVKAGYTIVWKRATRGIDLGGAVEYKSLPSGLHAVSEDLIYFVHEEDASDDVSDDVREGEGGESRESREDGQDRVGRNQGGPSGGGYAGLSAFVNLPTDEADARYARMIAVGVLVPRSYGRLGRAWRHADALLAMARKLAADRNETPLLEAYWRDHGSSTSLASSDSPPGQPLVPSVDPLLSPMVPGTSQPTAASGGTNSLLFSPSHHLSPHHPARSLTALLDTFGPLLFPIYRAALLRKRILISTHAPVRQANNFVYDLSVLANIPLSVANILEPNTAAQQRIRPLFTIGVNDIPFLSQDATSSCKPAAASGPSDASASRQPYRGPGWIACTTDSILAMKGELWDVLITMPPPSYASPSHSGATATAVLNGKEHRKNKNRGARETRGDGSGSDKAWPTVVVAKGVPLKATQRDLRRFRALRAGLDRLKSSQAAAAAAAAAENREREQVTEEADDDNDDDDDDDDDDDESLLAASPLRRTATAASSSSSTVAGAAAEPRDGQPDGRDGQLDSHSQDGREDAQLVEAAEPIVEPVTWAALAYNGFMWWASAGEQLRAEDVEENIQDASLLAGLELGPTGPPFLHQPPPLPSQPSSQPPSLPPGTARAAVLHDSILSLTNQKGEASGAQGTGAAGDQVDSGAAATELAIIAYFHRLTTQMLSVVADIVDHCQDDDDDDIDEDEDENEEGEAETGERLLDDEDQELLHGQPLHLDDDNDDYDDDDDADDADDADEHAHLLGARRSGLSPGPSSPLLLRRRTKRTRAAAARARARASRGGRGGRGGWRLPRSQRGRGDRQGQEGDQPAAIRLNSDALTRMGLDVWSPADADFVRDLALLYLGRPSVQVEGKGFEVCGFKVC